MADVELYATEDAADEGPKKDDSIYGRLARIEERLGKLEKLIVLKVSVALGIIQAVVTILSNYLK